MVFRVYVEKKPGFDGEAKSLERELRSLLGASALTNLRVINRYDVEGISEELFASCVPTAVSYTHLRAPDRRRLGADARGGARLPGLCRGVPARPV